MQCQICGKELGTYLCSSCKKIVCSKCKTMRNDKVLCKYCYSGKGMRERPLGVSIISILGILYAVCVILFTLFLTIMTSLSSFLSPIGLGDFIGANIALLVLLVIGLVQFAISYGLWNMRLWALNVEIGLYVLNIGLNALELLFFPLLLIFLAIPVYIVWYLNSKRTLFY
jgi:hypothetical protein